MKKLNLALIVLIVILAFTVCVSAASAKTDLYDAAKDVCPRAYRDYYLGIVQNILDQIDVTPGQADTVIGLIEEGQEIITTDKGYSLDKYDATEIAAAVDLFKRACDALSIEVEMYAVADAKHPGDIAFNLYYGGNLIAEIDGDAFKASTGSNVSGGMLTRPTVNVKFDTDGGSEALKIKVRKDSTIERPDDPTKEGFVFGGWYSDEACTVEFDFNKSITSDITLYAKWVAEEEKDDKDWTNPYTDVDEDAWYYDAVRFADENGIMNGVGNAKFDPDSNLTRGMFVTMLYRIEAEPAVASAASFKDVAAGSWYEKAINWAAANNIVNGVSATEFNPDDNITREQMVTVIFRYAQYKGINVVTLAERLHFGDASQISEYAVSAMNWATGLNIIQGYDNGNVGPQNDTTRAQAALVLMRMNDAKIF